VAGRAHRRSQPWVWHPAVARLALGRALRPASQPAAGSSAVSQASPWWPATTIGRGGGLAGAPAG